MWIEQFVMAYGAEQDRIRALLPDGFHSLRPVLRINAEVRGGEVGYLEFNTPVEKEGNRGWVNIAYWKDVPFVKVGNTTRFELPVLEIAFTRAGIQGGCPAEKDNCGCWFGETLRLPESIDSNKEFCDCNFSWKLPGGAFGKSTGVTLPAFCTDVVKAYPRMEFTWENAARIRCDQVLGTYVVTFRRDTNFGK